MEYYLATIQLTNNGFYSKLVLATDTESAKKLAADFGEAKHGKQFSKAFVSETLKGVV